MSAFKDNGDGTVEPLLLVHRETSEGVESKVVATGIDVEDSVHVGWDRCTGILYVIEAPTEETE